MNPTLYIIAGCNGAGKTTASFSLLPSILNCDIFINADEIAREIAPGEVEKVAFEAGRQMIEQINARIRERETFAFETTYPPGHIEKLSYLRRLWDIMLPCYFFG